jgi:hypothetical protein
VNLNLRDASVDVLLRFLSLLWFASGSLPEIVLFVFLER